VQHAQDFRGENTLVHDQQRLPNLRERPPHARQLDADIVRALQIHQVYSERALQGGTWQFGGRLLEGEERLELLEVDADPPPVGLVPDCIFRGLAGELVPVELLHAQGGGRFGARGRGGRLQGALRACTEESSCSSWMRHMSCYDVEIAGFDVRPFKR
jgi:hypothetical protein